DENHLFLVSRYAHILYQITKNNSYSKKARKAYYELAIQYHGQLSEGGSRTIHDFVEVAEAYAKLSAVTKFQQDQCKQQIIAWYRSPNQHLFYYTRMVEVIVGSALFKRQDLAGFTANAITTWRQTQTRSHDEDHLEVCLKLARKEGADVKAIYHLMAEIQL